MARLEYKKSWKGLGSAAAILTLLSACSTAEAPGRDPTSEPPENKTAGMTPVASIPDKDVYLYPDTAKTAILAVGDTRQTMDWRYSTVRGVMPALEIADYDHDGDDELAAVLELGSGTGLLLDELHVVELTGTNGAGERPFADHVFQEEDYLAQLGDALSFEKTEQAGKWLGRIAAGDKKYEVDISAFVDAYGAEAIEEKLGYGAVVYFNAADTGLSLRAAVGLVIDGLAEPQYIGNITAAIRYEAGSFTLGSYAFTAE
ncbi:hypothetical protein [Cohnella hashimotonis]|uniref:VCBS repeat-containing protein n=1 Tax=Cohnella hashimotonis TaxID=2826895 RepID=A0ABT6TSC3_9BACL|nr:hypothetical protein [Cohnella hashimotonis]MDI4649118.1 hypothetical protein [Cohnella hashimotonis]